MEAYRYRPSLRSRTIALALSLAICILIALMLIRMGALLPGSDDAGSRLVAMSFSPDNARQSTEKVRSAAKTQARPQGKPTPPTVQPAQPRPEPVVPAPAFLRISREDFAAADISKMARRPAESGGETGSGQPGGGAQGPGEGPGGARLYNAEWYREPTRAEMATYMPQRDIGSGWATIACRTEERFRVTDCRELAESPPGSGLSRAMRQAAWQFLVRPPRINGRPVIGAWVRIRFDFTVTRSDKPGETAD